MPCFADHGSYTAAFQRFLACPQHILFTLPIDKNDPVGINAETLERGRVNSPGITHPNTNPATRQLGLQDTGKKAADGRCKFGTRADKLVQHACRKYLVGKGAFDWAQPKVFGFPGCGWAEASPTGNILPELINDRLFFFHPEFTGRPAIFISISKSNIT